MNILLTGKPKSGKTTLLRRIITDVADKEGFYTSEIREGDRRSGFQVEASDGSTVLLASTQQPSGHQVGRFYVQLTAFDNFMAARLRLSPPTSKALVYLDEIGQMQLMSDQFQALAERCLDHSGLTIGTISAVFTSDFIERVRARADVIQCVVTPENREAIELAVAAAVRQRAALLTLPPNQHDMVRTLAHQYAEAGQWTSFYKLFNNATSYAQDGAVRLIDERHAVVHGRHAAHALTLINGRWTCDCPLFVGQAPYENQAAECSHVQAIQVLLAS